MGQKYPSGEEGALILSNGCVPQSMLLSQQSKAAVKEAVDIAFPPLPFSDQHLRQTALP